VNRASSSAILDQSFHSSAADAQQYDDNTQKQLNPPTLAAQDKAIAIPS